MMKDKLEALERALKREKAARKYAEKILEEKSTELFYLNQNLLKNNHELEEAIKERINEIEKISRFPDENPSPVLRLNHNLEIEYFNKAFEQFKASAEYDKIIFFLSAFILSKIRTIIESLGFFKKNFLFRSINLQYNPSIVLHQSPFLKSIIFIK